MSLGPDSPHAADPARVFPRGLIQPEGEFRFAADALLLACFAMSGGASGRTPGSASRILDLGCGCGVAGLACLLLDPTAHLTGLDISPDQTAAALANAAALDLASRYAALALDLREIRTAPDLPPESFDAVIANPPYRPPGAGRASPLPGRNRALFEVCGGVTEFALAASYALKNKGSFFLVHLAERLPHVFAALAAAGLEPKRLLPVQPRPGAAAGLVLIRAAKNGGPGLTLDPPLAMYGPGAGLSPQVLDFCPFLACNPRN